ncbi:MAG: hypothetical protein CK533_04535 [Acidobacterium sp.]|nr:MAG: hypothetical protein CK533_04535 [Acidobacterium sp.]
MPVPIINADDIRRRSLTRSVIAALVVVQDATGGIVVIPAMPGTSLDVGQMVEVVGRADTRAARIKERITGTPEADG